ncbi:MAG: molecular chaperone TorD family protein [Halodesulfurarchaeum sp.]|nr:molecular chaperone TorD family protein [Halodesulfurarchaeum sp.]
MAEMSEDETGRVYRILAAAYLEPPTEEWVSDMSRWAESWLESDADSLTADVAGPLETIRETESDEIETFNAEFTRLFRGSTNHSAPDPPYESLYMDGAIYGQSTTAVRNAYRNAGFDIEDEDRREPADHLGIELEFLGELRSREAAGDEEAAALQRAFIDGHLGRWIGDFEDEVMAADPVPFYGAVLELTTSLIEAESQRLDGVTSGESN